MKRTTILLLALLVIFGCAKQPTPIDQIPATKQPATPAPPSTTTAAPTTTPQPRLTDDQLFRLFSTAWKLDYDATMAYPENASYDQEALKSILWSYTIQDPVEVYFKDAGIQWNQGDRVKYLIELPANGDKIHASIRYLDDMHFALDNGPHWLVFTAKSPPIR